MPSGLHGTQRTIAPAADTPRENPAALEWPSAARLRPGLYRFVPHKSWPAAAAVPAPWDCAPIVLRPVEMPPDTASPPGPGPPTAPPPANNPAPLPAPA